MNTYLTLYENFSDWFEIQSMGLAKKTIKQYLFIVKSLVRFLENFHVRTLNDLSPDIFSKFIQIKPNKNLYSVSSVIQRIAALDIFFAWAIENKWIYENNNPVIYYKKMKIQPRRFDAIFNPKNIPANILTPQEQNILICSVDRQEIPSVRDHCIALMILGTGLFAEEITTLKMGAIDFNRGYLIIHKDSEKERRVDIDLTICGNVCKRWNNERKQIPAAATNQFYFINRNGKQIEPNRLYEIVSKLLIKSGIQKSQMGPDLLRQTAIFNMLRNGSTVEEVKKLTGITTSTHVEKYLLFV
jgi:site-specific recombinase XerD